MVSELAPEQRIVIAAKVPAVSRIKGIVIIVEAKGRYLLANLRPYIFNHVGTDSDALIS